jgi:hypothetical protein
MILTLPAETFSAQIVELIVRIAHMVLLSKVAAHAARSACSQRGWLNSP